VMVEPMDDGRGQVAEDLREILAQRLLQRR
jgi:hypothetical protein